MRAVYLPGAGTWRSLVAHLLWEQGVGGSNPPVPTSTSLWAGVAQLVEHQPSKLRVAGSRPVSRSIVRLLGGGTAAGARAAGGNHGPGPLARRVEAGTSYLQVAGSNPAGRATY